MTDRSILIVGAGIGGLSAGCYAQMNGYKVRILEMHARPGGQCTAWTRHGFTFDGCIHNLAGTNTGGALFEMWRELGVLPKIGFHPYEELVSVERPNGPPLILYTNLDRLSAHLKELSPADSRVIDELITGARRFVEFDLMGLSVATPFERFKALRHIPFLARYGGTTLEQFARRFKDPFLAEALPKVIYDWPQTPVVMLMSFLGRAHVGDFGWANGGSGVFADAIAHRFKELGGEIRYHAKVASILVEGDRAVGVKLDSGEEIRADIVVSNANGYMTIFDWLKGRYAGRAVRRYYSHPEDRIEMGIHVSLGVDRDLSGEPHALVLPLAAPVRIAGEMRSRLYVEIFNFDPALAPKGKTVVKVVLGTGYERWRELAKDPERYAAEKQQIARLVVQELGKRFRGIDSQIEVLDVATPATMERYTGVDHGYKTPITRMIMSLFAGRSLSRTLPGLANFYMVGQWAGSPGVPLVAAMGRNVAKLICSRDGVTFQRRSVTPAKRSQPVPSAIMRTWL